MHRIFGIDIDGSLVRIALTPGIQKFHLAYTENITKGNITLYDLTNCTKLRVINAHKTPIIQMTFNPKGNLLATSSSDVKYVNL